MERHGEHDTTRNATDDDRCQHTDVSSEPPLFITCTLLLLLVLLQLLDDQGRGVGFLWGQWGKYDMRNVSE